jgi:hypothetical protein
VHSISLKKPVDGPIQIQWLLSSFMGLIGLTPYPLSEKNRMSEKIERCKLVNRVRKMQPSTSTVEAAE